MACHRTLALIAIAFGAFALGMGSAPAQDKPGDIKQRLIGTWLLVAYVDGKDQPIRGPRPTGLVFYDAAGNMAVQIMPDRERPKFGFRQATPEQAKDVLSDYTAYFGTYVIDVEARIIRHHLKGNINPVRWANSCSCGDLNLPKGDA